MCIKQQVKIEDSLYNPYVRAIFNFVSGDPRQTDPNTGIFQGEFFLFSVQSNFFKLLRKQLVFWICLLKSLETKQINSAHARIYCNIHTVQLKNHLQPQIGTWIMTTLFCLALFLCVIVTIALVSVGASTETSAQQGTISSSLALTGMCCISQVYRLYYISYILCWGWW